MTATTPSKVFFVPFYVHHNAYSHEDSGRAHVLSRLVKACMQAGMGDVVAKGDITALKMHFGEDGLLTYTRPTLPRTLIEAIKGLGAKPYLTDTNTLYRAKRHNAIDHLNTAAAHGFNEATMGAPVIIADGIHGHAYQDYAFEGGKYFKDVPIPDGIYDADSMIVLSHFTAHLAAGFGAAIKNLSMGCSTPQGKRRMHCHAKPSVDEDKCTACRVCEKWCPTKAIKVDGKARVDESLCMACGECTVVCKFEAITIPWDSNTKQVQEKMAEYALAVSKQKEGKCLYVNSLLDITPHCDCMGSSQQSFVPDIGLLVSRDPVAIDRASTDFVNGKFKWDGKKVVQGEESDPLRKIYSYVDWSIQLKYAAEIGLGSDNYELVEVK